MVIKQEQIFQMVLYNYVTDDTELNLLHFEVPVSATWVDLLKNYINLVLELIVWLKFTGRN